MHATAVKIDPEIEKEVARIEANINDVRASIKTTDDTISRLSQLNARRKQYLRQLGQKRSELLTFELF